jgi:hypothetical protein
MRILFAIITVVLLSSFMPAQVCYSQSEVPNVNRLENIDTGDRDFIIGPLNVESRIKNLHFKLYKSYPGIMRIDIEYSQHVETIYLTNKNLENFISDLIKYYELPKEINESVKH